MPMLIRSAAVVVRWMAAHRMNCAWCRGTAADLVLRRDEPDLVLRRDEPDLVPMPICGVAVRATV